MNMNAHELLDYRIKLIRDTQAWKKPDRVAINANMFTWMFLDAGYPVSTATRDYGIIDECITNFVKKYRCDQVNPLNSGFRNAFLISDSLGGTSGYSDTNDANLNAKIDNLIYADEYDDFLDPGNYVKVVY